MNSLKLLWIRRRVKRRFRKTLGYPLNLGDPQTYCEKIQWLKFNRLAHDGNVIALSDKYAARAVVRSMGFGEQLVPLYGSWDSPEEIDWHQLPGRFVLKLNNGSGPGCRWFVEDKSAFSKPAFVREVRARMAKTYGEKTGQLHYGKMPAKIIAEEYLLEDQRAIKDYKFYCFHGKIAFFSVEEGKVAGTPARDYFDLDWSRSRVKFRDDLPRPESAFTRPENFAPMVRMAERLSRGFPHVRVDLYNVAGKVYFGELTYTPENGFTRWDPPSLDLEYGRLMDIRGVGR